MTRKLYRQRLSGSSPGRFASRPLERSLRVMLTAAMYGMKAAIPHIVIDGGLLSEVNLTGMPPVA